MRTQRNRASHLDVRQRVPVRPITGQSLNVLLSRQSQVVVATAGDVDCEGERETRRTGG